jgi:hypothetical protein
MNWEAIGAVGEIVGAAGVIVTLVYLSLPIRQNTRASKAATVQNMTDKWVQINLFLAESSVPVRTYAKLGSDTEEGRKALALYRALFHQWSNNHYQFLQGVLDEKLFQPTIQEIESHLEFTEAGSSLRMAWSHARHIYNEDFCNLMDGILRNSQGDA